MTDNFFDIDPNVAEQLSQGLQIGGGIELPIVAPYFSWRNGSPQNRMLKDAHPVVYFGGWETGQENMDAALEAYGEAGPGFYPAEMTSQAGKAYNAVLNRYLIVAPIAYRDCWTKKEEGGGYLRRAKWEEGYDHHKVQFLVYCARRLKDGPLEAWAPVVLTVSGYNAGFLLDAIKTWARFIEPARKKHAPNIPPWGFWVSLGTFGPEPKVRQVGKRTAKPVNPVEPYIKDKEPTLDLLKSLFVGKETLATMAETMKMCQEWLDAWKEDPRQNNGSGPSEPEFDDFVPEFPEDI